jgi:hypothetical protein
MKVLNLSIATIIAVGFARILYAANTALADGALSHGWIAFGWVCAACVGVVALFALGAPQKEGKK